MIMLTGKMEAIEKPRGIRLFPGGLLLLSPLLFLSFPTESYWRVLVREI